MNYLKAIFMNYETVEKAAVINGVSRYWTEVEPTGINWMSVAGVIFLAYFIYSLCKHESL
ncbi:hypothetical protein vBYenPRambo_002 [Yersinia phage vB_YenP_Rambo]|uniref:Uncharacterized protein n=1 Tax=Yersinia phage vB_YenP_Rambo TaxID=2880894 RepID=A0AC61TNP8_9CAUD|nr:hypothetical protein vBYenPRambo_002 [Yersinia phage vB_YenP_Rambo]